MAKSSIYLETTIIGWLTNRPSRDPVLEARRIITHRWWNERRFDYDLFISRIVLDEIARGDPLATRSRLSLVRGIAVLPVDTKVVATADALVQAHSLPKRALQDAFHIAVATHHQVHFLMTWNCTHIANPHIIRSMRKHLASAGLTLPEIATPEEMLGGKI